MKKKICVECKYEKNESEFYRRSSSKYGMQSYCIECARKAKRDWYRSQKGIYLYYIKVNGVIRWVGSTTNLKLRTYKHKTSKSPGNLIYELTRMGIDYTNADIEIWVYDVQADGLNLNRNDLEYYEHKIIRLFKDNDENLLNKRINSKFIARDRYIDEIPIEPFRFKLYMTLKI